MKSSYLIQLKKNDIINGKLKDVSEKINITL